MADPVHPLDVPPLARRLQVVRALCRGLTLALGVAAVGATLTVRFALGGEPLAGNRVTVGGVSVLTVVAAAVTVAVPVVVAAVSGVQTRAGVRRLAAEPPTPPGPLADADGLVGVFAAATFAEYAVAEAVGLTWAVLYHATADPLMLLWIAGLVVVQVARYPTDRRAKVWFDRAAELLARERAALP